MSIQRITILGAGTMGRGIAYLAGLSGYETRLYDVTDHVLQNAMRLIESTFAKSVEKKKLEASEAHKGVSRIWVTSDLEAAVQDADLVVEAAPEDLALKKDLFAQVDVLTPTHTILASNTSSISISELSKSVQCRAQFVGMHFFNPPHVMKLVEIVLGAETSDATVAIVSEVTARMGRETILVKDSPGFATSRLGLAIGLEAIRMLEDGVASAADIDRAMELGYNHPMGPLRLTDLVGLDVRLGIAEYLTETLGPRFEPPKLLREMVEKKLLGKKTGKGFYDWEP
ncbi:MAG: 3-hydroxyacyl-CoA dehydrogenase family protein [Thermoanaerobaculia bacterium]